MFVEIFLPTTQATEMLGARIAQHLETGDFIALWGGLGAGKTTFARGLIRALDPAAIEVPSPTYTLVQTYETPKGLLWHFDLYRLKHAEEVFELGWRDAADGLSLVEWPQQAGALVPADRLDVSLMPDASSRHARLEPHGERWQERLHEL